MEPLGGRPDAGGTSRWFNTLQDVTGQKRGEQQLAAMAQRLVTLQEKERRDIARELHDRVGQNLSALSINLARLASAPDAGRLEESRKLVEETGVVIQDVLTELKPPMLASYGLVDALRFQAREVSRRTGIAIEVHGPDPVVRLDSEIEMALFRIAQAALNNIMRHARARHAYILFSAAAGNVKFEVRDDGIGFDPARALASGRWGLTAIRERAEAIGGALEVASAPGEGARIIVRLGR
jgi:signal transduction histidine kinase